jgi:hypothetical protein
MKKKAFFNLIFIGSLLPLHAQIYTPTSTIQGASWNNYVGIGTSTPSANLNIEGGHGDSRFLIHANGNGNPDTYHADLTLWASEPGLTWSGVGIGNNIHNFKTAAGGLTLLNTSRGGSYIRLLDNAMLFNVVSISGVDKQSFSIDGNGNVGVGTTAPISKLSVLGSISLISGLSNTSSRPAITESTLPNGEIRAYNGANSLMDDGFVRISAGGGTNGSVKSYIELSGYSTIPDMDRNIVIGTSGNERLRIDKNGNIGIGTTNPTSKLTVAGDINSREVKVTVDAGADFVFEKDYNLPSLASLDTYIKENKHLPEIASAKEMQANGINLSEMNIKLLQKIEELTLYVIEQNKEIKELKKVIHSK